MANWRHLAVGMIVVAFGVLGLAVPSAGAQTNGPGEPALDPVEQQALVELLRSEHRLLHSYWSSRAGVEVFARPAFVRPWDTLSGIPRQCVFANQTVNELAQYCALDNTIYLSVGYAEDVLLDHGIGAVTSLLAHEFGHTVQHATLDPLLRLRSARSSELQADCYAGEFIAHLRSRNIVDADQVRAAAAYTFSLGDFAIYHPQHHGTPTERRASWYRGFGGWGCRPAAFLS